MTDPWVGIHTARSPAATPVEEVLRRWMKNAGRRPRGYTQGSDWMAFRGWKVDPDWWRDVPAWRRSVAEELFVAWGECHGVVDEAVVEARTGRRDLQVAEDAG